MIQKVEWDSQHFNMNVGIYHVPTQNNSIDLESLEREAKARHYDVVYVRSKNPISDLERRHTFRDERIVYAKENTRITPPNGHRNRINTVSAYAHVRIK